MATLSPDLVREFVLAAHGNLEKVRAMLAEQPELLEAKFLENDESAIEAASHVGHRAIAEYLLQQGAELNLCTAAMLGMKPAVIGMLRRDPGAGKKLGVHGLSPLFHAAIGGNTEIADMLYAVSPNEKIEPVLHAAVASRNPQMVRWALAQRPDPHAKRFDGKTPLQVAQAMGNDEIVQMLREAGATE
ncbi:MAG TPA: ankyrin repeat domain-containing protein [Chloroflexota bacterium]|jgi:ankyrin repeat protein|nr:ankyrin repeat domain-containing protein [Chloroflexota bacterium]